MIKKFSYQANPRFDMTFKNDFINFYFIIIIN